MILLPAQGDVGIDVDVDVDVDVVVVVNVVLMDVVVGKFDGGDGDAGGDIYFENDFKIDIVFVREY